MALFTSKTDKRIIFLINCYRINFQKTNNDELSRLMVCWEYKLKNGKPLVLYMNNNGDVEKDWGIVNSSLGSHFKHIKDYDIADLVTLIVVRESEKHPNASISSIRNESDLRNRVKNKVLKHMAKLL